MVKKSYENLQKDIRLLKTPDIECWKNQYPDKEFVVHLECPEITCLCPKTGLPDFGTLFLSYSPFESCLELKSFKLYLQFYRNIGIFHEHLVNKILDDILEACFPISASLRIEMKPRGGIITTVKACSKSKEVERLPDA